MVTSKLRQRFRRWGRSLRPRKRTTKSIVRRKYGRVQRPFYKGTDMLFMSMPRMLKTKLKFSQRITSSGMKDGDLVLYANSPVRICLGQTVDGGTFGNGAGQFSGAGFYGQSQYIDILAKMYNYVIVTACKITVRAAASGSGATGRIFYLYPDTVSTYPAILDVDSPDNLGNKPGVVYKINTGNTSSNGIILKNFQTTKRMIGVRDCLDARTQLECALADPPSEADVPLTPWYWHLREQSLDQATASGSWYYIKMVQYCTFTELKKVDQREDPS